MRDSETYRVKAFAQMAGVTVRTLQYYDREGLLKPSQYTRDKHRLYERQDLLRLQQIMTLKYMGYSLNEIRRLLTSPEYDVRRSLQIQKDALEQRVAQLQKVVRALDQTLATLSSLKPAELDWAVVTEIIRGIAGAEKWQGAERYFSPEQRDLLAERAKAISPQALVKGQRDWADLMAAFQAQRERGRAPSDAAVQRLAAKMDKLVHAFTGGDKGLTQSLRHLYTDWNKLPADQRPYDAELQRYMGRAYTIYQKEKNKTSKPQRAQRTQR